MKLWLSMIVLSAGLGGASFATAVPVVTSDIPTTHSLVSMVMDSVGEPTLLMRANASPHEYSLRPSEAARLRQSDVLFWTSATLTPWLPKAMKSVAPELTAIELATTPGTLLLPMRDSANFLPHTDEQAHDQHAVDHDTSSSAVDPHAWLDIVNAQHWLQVIADALSEIDPVNASIYQANAQRGIESLASLQIQIADQLRSVQREPFIVFHDSYHYFENRFDLHATASISLSDSTQPGIRQINVLREILERHPGTCVFSEPQFSARMLDTVTHGLDARRGVLDPLGAALPPGTTLYSQVLTNLANALLECLSDSG